MEKTIEIDGKQIIFKSTGSTPLRYKAQFGKDYFAEIMKMEKLSTLDVSKNLELVDFEVFYNIVWVLAKTANKDIPEPLTWLDGFDEFPLFDIIPEIQDLITASMEGKKK